MAASNSNDDATASPPSATYGWIGIGNMGFGMAMNIGRKIPSNAHLIINDINQDQVTKFLSEAVEKHGLDPKKVSTANTPAEIAQRASIILSSLPHGEAVIEVYTNPKTGLIAGLSSESSSQSQPKLLIETSTIHTSHSTTARDAITSLNQGHHFIDSPISGGIPIATAGTLTAMAGAPSPEIFFSQAHPILSTFATNIFHCGPSGSGLATKLINNYVAMTAFIGLCEGMSTGIKHGLDPKVLGQIINVSSGMSWNSLHMNPVKGVLEGDRCSSNRDFEGGFPTELARGVMGMARGLMQDVGVKSVLGSKVEGVFEVGVRDERCKGKECRSVWRLWEGEGEGLVELVD